MSSKKNLIFAIILLLLWQGFFLTDILPPHKVPSPLQIANGLGQLLTVGIPPGCKLMSHSLASLIRVLLGFIIASLIGVPLGIMLGWSKLLRELFTPVVETIRPIPPLAWIPLAILWFGIGLKSSTFIIFLGCFFPILLSTVSGVLSVDTILVDAARTLGAKDKEIFLKVLVPGSIPSIFTGLRIGMGIGWMTLVAAEFTGVKSGYGLGYMIMVARDIQRPDLIVSGMITIGLIGYILDAMLRIIESRLLIWR